MAKQPPEDKEPAPKLEPEINKQMSPKDEIAKLKQEIESLREGLKSVQTRYDESRASLQLVVREMLLRR